MTTTGEVLKPCDVDRFEQWAQSKGLISDVQYGIRCEHSFVPLLRECWQASRDSAPQGNAAQEGVFVGRVFIDQLTGQRSIVPGGDITKIADMTKVYAAPSNKEVER